MQRVTATLLFFTFFQSGTISKGDEPQRSETGHDAVVKWRARQERVSWNEREIRVGEARTYRGQHRYGGDLGGTLGFPVKLGLHTIPTLDPLMNHIPSGR